jgi:hypothetical protein
VAKDAQFALNALKGLRNIPEEVLLALATQPAYAEAISNSFEEFSDRLFSYLWKMHSNDKLYAIRLVSRTLSKAQIALVLSTEKRPGVAQAILQYNDLSDTEALTIKIKKCGASLSRLIVGRYNDNEVVLKHFLPSLDWPIKIEQSMKGSEYLISDAEVVKLAKYIGSDEKRRVSGDVHMYRTLMESRPHLIDELLVARNRWVILALSGSRHIGDEDRQLILFGFDPVTKARDEEVAVLPDGVYELACNPMANRNVLRIVKEYWEHQLFWDGKLRVWPKDQQVYTDIAILGYEGLYEKYGLDKMVQSVCTLKKTDRCWDLLALAENPYLDESLAKKIYAALAKPEVVSVLGKARCEKARGKLTLWYPELGPDALPEGVFSKVTAREYIVAANRTMDRLNGRELDFAKNDYSVAGAFKSTNKGDANVLVEILGSDPASWEMFFGLLSSSDGSQSVKDVANVATRIGQSKTLL